ncbi:MAG TPA: hypothetical protein VK646_10475 [Actinomycetota bacterium]|nr:hypothetical protein [Actinomycetota bacterium]
MPAPRTCRTCGGELHPDLRWCPRCYAPVYELTPRAKLHDGDFVSAPLAEGGHRPHWSRWEKSATTFGPAGRIALTVLVVLTLPMALLSNMFVYAAAFPIVAATTLGSIWARGWVVPDEPDLPPLPAAGRGEPDAPWTAGRVAREALPWICAAVAMLAVSYGPLPLKAAVLIGACIGGPIWFWKRVLDR